MDAELFQVNETFVAFQREHKRGEKLRESDLVNWGVSEEEQEREIAKLLVRGRIERVPPAVAEPVAAVLPMTEPTEPERPNDLVGVDLRPLMEHPAEPAP